MAVQATSTSTTSGIKLSKFVSDLNAYDANNDGLFSRQEVAKAATKMNGDELALAYNLLNGGSSGQGFIPATGGVSVSDFAQLAAANTSSGSSAQFIDPGDMTSMFGSNALTSSATEQNMLSNVTNIANGTSTSGTGSSNVSSLISGLLQFFMQFIQALLSSMSSSSNTAGTTV